MSVYKNSFFLGLVNERMQLYIFRLSAWMGLMGLYVLFTIVCAEGILQKFLMSIVMLVSVTLNRSTHNGRFDDSNSAEPTIGNMMSETVEEMPMLHVDLLSV